MKTQSQATIAATVRLIDMSDGTFRVELDLGDSACSIFDELSSADATVLYERIAAPVRDSKRALLQLATEPAEECRHVG